MVDAPPRIPVLNLCWAEDSIRRPVLLRQLYRALFDVGFLYVSNHGVPESTILGLVNSLPVLFDLPSEEKARMTKLNSPHFLGYSGFAEETTLGKQDLREQFDFGTELNPTYKKDCLEDENVDGRDFTELYWKLRGPNQWPDDDLVPGFRKKFVAYHDAVQDLSYRFVHLIEEAFDVPIGTFDHFFGRLNPEFQGDGQGKARQFLPPQHRIKLVKYPPSQSENQGQGVGAHRDSSGWLTFLYQASVDQPGLEVLSADGKWLSVPSIPNTFVVNFGNAFEAATDGAVKATVHRVVAPRAESQGGRTRYSIPFFMGLPLDMTVSEVQKYIPAKVRHLRRLENGGEAGRETVDAGFWDPKWDSLGQSQLRKWIRSHRDVGLRWYGEEVVQFYSS